jgi:uncharacterized membrane protein YbhN (UPF0104 family)
MTGVLVAVSGLFVSRHAELLCELVSMSDWWLFVQGVVVGVGLCARAYFLKELVRELGGRVSGRECFCLIGATNALSVLMPPAAAGAYRAFYLNSRHGIEVLPFVGGSALFAIVGVAVWALAGILALVASDLSVGKVSQPLLIVLLVSVACLVAALQGRGALRLLASTKVAWAARMADKPLWVASSTRVGVAAMVAVVGASTVQVAGYWLVLHSFGLRVGMIETTAVLAFHQLGGVIGVTPGAIGIQEGAAVLVAGCLGLDVVKMAVVFALIRVARIGMSIVVGAPCWWLLPYKVRPC